MLKSLVGFDFGAFPIYQIMLFVAFFAGLLMFGKMLRRGGYSPFVKKRIRRSFFWGTVCGLIGSNVINWFLFEGMMDESFYFRITQGGYSFFFGILCFFGASALFLRLNRMNLKICLNMAVPAVLLAQFFARIGCILSGCCFGKEITLFGVSFLFPTSELEAIFALVMCIILTNKAPGKRLPIYLFSYSIFRFGFEFLRGDARGALFGITLLSPTQIFALLTLIISGLVLFLRPFLKLCQAEYLLDDLRDKIKTLRYRIFKKPYLPLPYNYVPMNPKKNPLRIIVAIVLPITVLFAGFVYINPFGMAWCEDTRYTMRNTFSFLFEERGREEEIGETNGISLLDASDQGVVANKEAAKKVIEAYDTWANAKFSCFYSKTLPNGNHAYGFMQTVNGKPVLGSGRVLVTDADHNALYVVGDAACLSYTDETVATYALNSPTVQEAFGNQVSAMETMDCWYDTGDGLVAAQHVILSKDGKTATMGAVIDRSNSRIISLTGTEPGVLSTTERNHIQAAAQTVEELVKADDQQKLETLRKTKKAESKLEQDRQRMERALSKAYKESGLTAEEFQKTLEATNEIADCTPGLNQNLYREILSEESRQTLLNSGAEEKKADTCAEKVTKAFTSCGIKQTEDEVATQLSAQERKATFRHTIAGNNDTDVYNLSVQENHTAQITINTERPLDVQIYGSDGKAVTSLYVEEDETLTLYPEDGSDFTLRISSNDALENQSDKPADYKIALQSSEEITNVPLFVNTSLYRIGSAYENSNTIPYLSMCSDGLISTEETVAVGLMTPVLDSCSGCAGLEENMDSAKSLIAMTLIPNGQNMQELSFLRGSEMELTYFAHVETENGAALKAKLCITMDGLEIYNGFTFLQLEQIDRTTGMDEQTAQIFRFLGGILGSNYYITDINTDALYHTFGDTAGNISSSSDLPSLYDLQENVTVTHDGMTFMLKEIDEERALQLRHSQEKIDAFVNYTTRQNIMELKQARAAIYSMQMVFETINQCGDPVMTMIGFATDPFGTVIGMAGEQNETTNELYTMYQLFFDMDGLATDMVADAVIESAGTLADELEVQVQSMDVLIESYRKKLR